MVDVHIENQPRLIWKMRHSLQVTIKTNLNETTRPFLSFEVEYSTNVVHTTLLQ